MDNDDQKKDKLMEVLDQLAKRLGTLMAGRFTGQVVYEINLSEGGFQSDYFLSRSRMTPHNSKKEPEVRNGTTRSPDDK